MLPNQVSTGLLDDIADGISCSAPVIDSDISSKHSNGMVKESVSQPTKTSQKWAKYKAVTNANRRYLYKQNPQHKRQSCLKNYYLHPSPVKRRALHSYYANPSPVKRHALDAYYSKHS